MSDLKQMIKNEFDKDRGLAKKIAEIAGYKNPTPLYKFLNEPNRELDSFSSLLKIVRELFPDEEFELMDEYLRTVDPNKKTARLALEYANVYRLSDLYCYLIESLSNCSNQESKEWAMVHGLNCKANKGEIPYLEVFDKVGMISYKSNEAKLFSKFVQAYGCYELRLISAITELATLIEMQVDNIKDEFLRESYKARLGLIMTTVNLHGNDMEKVQFYGNMVLENTSKVSIKSLIHLQMGNSHIFTNFDHAVTHFEKGLKLCDQTGNEKTRSELKSSMNFLMNYWGKKPLFLNESSENPSDIHEVAFYYIRQGEVEKGLGILERVDFESLNNLSKAFNFFYRGLATSDKNFYYESIKFFNIAGEKFYKNLPLIELKKLGENEVLLNALAT